MDRPKTPLRLVARTDAARRRVSRDATLHALAIAFVEADETTVDRAISALVTYLDPTLTAVPTDAPAGIPADTKGLPHE